MDIRQIILDRLEELGKTRYWLATTQTLVHKQTAFRYLYGGRNATRSDLIEQYFDLLGLTITPCDIPKKGAKSNGSKRNKAKAPTTRRRSRSGGAG